MSILLALFLAGCSVTPRGPEQADGNGQPLLSQEARQALATAEADWQRAKAAFALWTTADLAYENAKVAAMAGDSAAVIKYATRASELARLGLAQKDYPSTEKQ